VTGESLGAGFLTIARLLRPRGNRGELAAELTCDDVAMLDRFRRVSLAGGDRCREEITVERAWLHGKRLVLKFEGIDTISQAERLAGCEVQIPDTERPPAPPGRYYVADLLGCRVLEARSGRAIGEAREWIETGAVPLLRVEAGKRSVLIPFAAAICVEIDPARRLIRVDLPDGLEELEPGN